LTQILSDCLLSDTPAVAIFGVGEESRPDQKEFKKYNVQQMYLCYQGQLHAREAVILQLLKQQETWYELRLKESGIVWSSDAILWFSP